MMWHTTQTLLKKAILAETTIKQKGKVISIRIGPKSMILALSCIWFIVIFNKNKYIRIL